MTGPEPRRSRRSRLTDTAFGGLVEFAAEAAVVAVLVVVALIVSSLVLLLV